MRTRLCSWSGFFELRPFFEYATAIDGETDGVRLHLVFSPDRTSENLASGKYRRAHANTVSKKNKKNRAQCYS
jgi:hypothetical protein